MVVYDLTCPQAHHFEGWFDSADSFEKQRQEGHVSCPLCDSRSISRLPSAPYLSLTSAEPAPVQPAQGEAAVAVSSGILEALRHQVTQFIMAHTEDVGESFAEVALNMHNELEPVRNIRGKATAEEMADLHEEGVEFLLVDLPEIDLPKH